MLNTVIVTGAFVLFSAVHQGPNPEEAPPAVAADIALMEELRKKVEALPKERQEREGLQILLDNVDRFKSEPMRIQVYLSISKLYERFGDNDQAEKYFKMTGLAEGETGRRSALDTVSPEHLLDLVEQTGSLTAAIEQALQYPEGMAVTDPDFSSLVHKTGRMLIRSGDVDGAIELGITASRERPCDNVFATLETFASDADTHSRDGKSVEGLKAMRWLHSNSGSFGQSARFLSNLSYTEEDCGNIPEAIAAVEELVERHPESPDVAPNLLRLSFLSTVIGDEVAALDYLRQVIEGDGPAEYKERARRSLELSTPTTPVTVTFPPPAEEGSSFKPFLLLHLILFSSIAAVWWWVKRRPGKT